MKYSRDDNEITNYENCHNCHHVVFNLLDAHINQKNNFIAISIAAVTTVNYILRNLNMGYCVFSLHNKSHLMRDDAANSFTAHRTSSIQ